MQPLINGWKIPTGVHEGGSPGHRGEQESGSGLTPAPEPHRTEEGLAPRRAGKLQPSWDPGFNQLELVGSFRCPEDVPEEWAEIN